jgi:hypothetical protein
MSWLTDLVSDWTIVLIMLGALVFVFGVVEISNRNERRKWRRLVEIVTRAGKTRRMAERNGHH